MSRRIETLSTIVALALLSVETASAQTASRVIRLFEQRCTACHKNPDSERAPDVQGAPDVATLRKLPPETIYRSITTGTMRVHAEEATDEVKRSMVEWLSGRKLGSTESGDSRRMPNQCAANPPMGELSSSPAWNGWAPDATNARYQKTPGLSANQVPQLKLKWAFGFPGASSLYGQPTIAGGRVFIGADSGYVYSLDAQTGCVYWSFQAETGVRNATSVGAVNRPPPPKAPAGPPERREVESASEGRPPAQHAVFFGDILGNVYAVNAATGELLWKVRVDDHGLAAITGSPTLHEGRLYVPVASREEAAGSSLYYPCCTFRGSLVLLDANTGRQIWKTYTIADLPRPTKRNSVGTQLWTPSGAALWHAPTIDPAHRAVYLATGDAYTEPATSTTDAVMALDMDSGKVRWVVQDTPNDAWLVGCAQEPTENCPRNLGPDYDFGSSPILRTLPNGRRVLVAGQKSGQVFAHDPDQQGKVVWTTLLVDKLGDAEILFGGAADEQTAYFGLSNNVVAALDLTTGKQRWSRSVSSEGSRGGVTAAVSAIPGVVFFGGRDGILHAVSSDDGRTIWRYNMVQDVTTVNGVAAKGGAMGAPGPTIAGGILFVPSGYVGLGNGTPGNVLLAFAAQ